MLQFSCGFVEPVSSFLPSSRLHTCLLGEHVAARHWTRWIRNAAAFIVSYLLAIQSIAYKNSQSSTAAPCTSPTPSKPPARTLSAPEMSNTGPGSGSKIIYHIAHPPPSSYKRTKLVLQLQEASNTPRPIPAFNVFPSSVLAPVFARTLSKVRRASRIAVKSELVVVKAESYARFAANTDRDRLDCTEGDSWEDAMGLICPISEESFQDHCGNAAELRLPNGSAWTVRKLYNGNYELLRTEGEGPATVARWTVRNRKARPNDCPQNLAQCSRFAFSVIDPLTRRHPIIATLDHNTISVPSQVGKSNNMAEKIHQQIRSVILLSGIWVVLREGWARAISLDRENNSSGDLVPISSQVSLPYSPVSSFRKGSLHSSLSATLTSPVPPSEFLSRANSVNTAAVRSASKRRKASDSATDSSQPPTNTLELVLGRGLVESKPSAGLPKVMSPRSSGQALVRGDAADEDGARGLERAGSVPVGELDRDPPSTSRARTEAKLKDSRNGNGKNVGKWLWIVGKGKALGRKVRNHGLLCS